MSGKLRQKLRPRAKVLMTVIAVAVIAVLGAGQQASANIVGSVHDFSSLAFTTEICVVCHTPHNADLSVSDAPLWNHEVTTSTFTVYSSGTLDAVVGQPDGVSKLCLSCHDGSVAVDNFGGTTLGTTFVGTLNADAELGTDLTNDHPVSFIFDAALATSDGELFDPTSTSSGLGSTIDADMLFAGKVQCASCHDVHDKDENGFLLRKVNTGSALCLTCHDK